MSIWQFSLLRPIPDLSSPSPEEVEIPEYMEELTPSWMMCLGVVGGGIVQVNGGTVQNVLSAAEVWALKVSSGAQCGLLHVHVWVPGAIWLARIIVFIADHKFSKSEEKRSLIKTKTDAYFEQFSNVFAGMNGCYNAFLLFTCTCRVYMYVPCVHVISGSR